MSARLARFAVSAAVIAAALLAWELAVRFGYLKPYQFPPASRIARGFIECVWHLGVSREKTLSCALETAPTCCAATVPLRNRSKVGIPRILNLGGVFGFSSMLSLTTRSLSLYSVAIDLENRGDHLARPAPFGPKVE